MELIKYEETMRKRILFTLLFCVASVLMVDAQNIIESIRKEYQGVHEWIGLMSDNFPEDGIPSEYFDLHVAQNLPGTGPHDERIRMYYGELESEEGDPYPPHYLHFATAKYNFAAREYYEEYLYDNKGQVMFIYAITSDATEELHPYELRLYFDGKRLLRFTAKRYDGQSGYLDIPSLRKGPFKEEYSGTTIPEKYRKEVERCQQRAGRFLTMFKGIDDNTYL